MKCSASLKSVRLNTTECGSKSSPKPTPTRCLLHKRLMALVREDVRSLPYCRDSFDLARGIELGAELCCLACTARFLVLGDKIRIGGIVGDLLARHIEPQLQSVVIVI